MPFRGWKTLQIKDEYKKQLEASYEKNKHELLDKGIRTMNAYVQYIVRQHLARGSFSADSFKPGSSHLDDEELPSTSADVSNLSIEELRSLSQSYESALSRVYDALNNKEEMQRIELRQETDPVMPRVESRQENPVRRMEARQETGPTQRMESPQETDLAICGRCGRAGFVRDDERYCSGCGKTSVGCTCKGDRRQERVTRQREPLEI